MDIDKEKLLDKNKKNKKALSFLGSIFTFLFLDFIGQMLVIPLAILIVMVYFYVK